MPGRDDHRARGIPRHDGSVIQCRITAIARSTATANWSPARSPHPRPATSRSASSGSASSSVDNVTLEEGGSAHRAFSLFNKPKPEDVTLFTRDLALLLRAGARINDGLELLAGDPDFGRLRPVVADIRSRVVAGESFAEALARHEGLFPPMYVALIRVGEASGSLDQVLEVLADERTRTEALKRRLGDAVRYPVFVLAAAACVLLFFMTFVLPQFASVLQDFGAKVDPFILGVPEFLDLPARPFRCGAGDRGGPDRRRLAAAAPGESSPRSS